LERRGDLQRVRQSNRIARSNEGRRFGQALVDKDHGEHRKCLQGELDFVDQGKFFLASGLVRISARVRIEVTARSF
jgi:hypothetical protein